MQEGKGDWLERKGRVGGQEYRWSGMGELGGGKKVRDGGGLGRGRKGGRRD